MVTSHEAIILLIEAKSRCSAPFAKPTPITPPTRVCVVEIGKPKYDAATTVDAVAISAENPKLGVRAVIFLPTV